MNFAEEFAARFWTKVQKTSECWLWIGAPSSGGYGQIGNRNKRLMAHRVSWEIHFGAISDGMHVLHHCDTPCCVRPDHLFLGTQADNMADRNEKGRQSHGEGHACSKLTWEAVKIIRNSGAPQQELADRFGVTASTISQCKNEKSWRGKSVG